MVWGPAVAETTGGGGGWRWTRMGWVIFLLAGILLTLLGILGRLEQMSRDSGRDLGEVVEALDHAEAAPVLRRLHPARADREP